MKSLAQINNELTSVEVVRGAFSCLSYVAPDEARPVHINQLIAMVHRLSPLDGIADQLETLDSLREVCNLRNGYWIATPVRVVQFEEFSLLLSPSSTEELKRSCAMPV